MRALSTGFAHQSAGLRLQHLVIMAENGTDSQEAGWQQSLERKGHTLSSGLLSEQLHPACGDAAVVTTIDKSPKMLKSAARSATGDSASASHCGMSKSGPPERARTRVC